VAQEFEGFRIERRDAAAVVWMDRPEKLNAMGPAFFRELPVVLDSLGREPELRAIVLTGAGDAFSAGGDIASFGDLHDIEAYRRHLRLVFDAFHSVERAELPVIAAVNGVAYGGGTELTLACDLVIASERARFAFREPTVGLMPGYGIVRGPDVIGRHWTRWLAFTADIIDARQALEIGLVQQVVSHDRLLDEALAVAGRIAANAPLAVRLAKQFVNRDTGGRGLAETVEATALLFTTEDHKEGIAAFLDKRPPRFRGR
jgi:enoyl-CoA hydratase/carnithine racemase